MKPAVFIMLAAVLAVLIPTGLHRVDEGYVGVYHRGGALLGSFTLPGFHLQIPLLTRVSQVQVTLQTDKVTNIPCGTSGGVLIHFGNIEVVNRLRTDHVIETVRKYGPQYDRMWIFDKIHHEINQFCSSHTLQEVYIDLFDTLDESLQLALQRDCDKWETGIEIIATRVTKPRIPDNIARAYEAMEIEKVRLLIETQRQKVIEEEAETERLRAMIQADKEAEVSEITMQIALLEKMAQQTKQSLGDEMVFVREKCLADAQSYQQTKLAEANNIMFTPEFLQLETYKALQAAPKVFYGKDLHAWLSASNFTMPTIEKHNTMTAH